MKKTKIAFDLDGVIIDKPPIIPKALLERLFRGNCEEKLRYRFPKSKLEQKIRKLSHFYLLRQPIRKNVEIIKELARSPQYELFIVSSRYSFLQQETDVLFKKWNLNGIFKKVFLNLNDKQPHLFKEEKIKEIGVQVFVDDDCRIADFLTMSGKTKIFCFFQGKNKCQKAKNIDSLKEILE